VATGSDLSLGEHFCIARDTPHPHVAGRRLPPCPLFLASHGHRLGSRSPYQEPSPIPPDTFMSDDDGKYTRRKRNPSVFCTSLRKVIHRFPQLQATPALGRWRGRWI